MVNLLTVLNDRILRLARREIRGQTQKTRRLTTQHRRDLAALKHRWLPWSALWPFWRNRNGAGSPACRPSKREGGCDSRREASRLSTQAWPLGQGFWQARRRLGADDLRLGRRQVASS